MSEFIPQVMNPYYARMMGFGLDGSSVMPPGIPMKPGLDTVSALRSWENGQTPLVEQSGWGIPGVTSTPGATPVAAVGGGGFGDWFKQSGFLGSTDAKGVKTDGWGGYALGAAEGLLNTYMGMKQYGLYKDQLAESKRQFGLNYDAQKSTTNAQLEDRQRARVASNAGAYQSVGDYMNAYGIK